MTATVATSPLPNIATGPAFNLVDEAWIPIVGHPSGSPRASLRDVLVDAHRLRAVRHPSPLVTAALHRFLVAAVHVSAWPRTGIGPWGDTEEQAREAWLEAWHAGALPREAINAYLDRWHDRFWLLGGPRPFLQDPRVADDRRSGPGVLALEVDAKGAKPLFHRDLDAPIAPAEAACQLFAMQLFALGGILTPDPSYKGVITNSAQAGAFTRAGAACMVVEGRTLFETLLLNCHGLWPDSPGPGQRRTGDRPTWERDAPPDPRDREVTGHLDLLTRRPRRIRLWHRPGPDGRPVVDGAAVLKGEVHPESSWQSWQAYETMAAFRPLTDAETKDKTKAPFRAVRFREGRDLWRDSVALVQVVSAEVPALRTLQWLAKSGWLVPGDEDVSVARGPLADLAPLRVLGLGLVNDQKRAEMWRAESVEVPTRLILDLHARAELGDALAAAEEVGGGVRAATKRLAKTVLGEKPDPEKVTALTNALDPTATYWGEMGRRYPAWLDALARATLDDDGRRAIRHAWADDVWEAAHIAFGSLTASLDRSADALRAVANAEPILRSGLFAAMRTKRTGTGRQAIDVPTYAGQTWSPPTWRHGPDHSGQASEADATAPVPATGGHTQPTLR
jgi:CRISPR system Cascade subunit CasA